MKDETNPQAYPAFTVDGDTRVYQHGMTLRDYFAGQALVSFKPYIEYEADGKLSCKEAANWAQVCYAYADAMLKERAK